MGQVVFSFPASMAETTKGETNLHHFAGPNGKHRPQMFVMILLSTNIAYPGVSSICWGVLHNINSVFFFHKGEGSKIAQFSEDYPN